MINGKHIYMKRNRTVCKKSTIPSKRRSFVFEIRKRNWFVLILLSVIALHIIGGAVMCTLLIFWEDSFLFLPLAILLFGLGALVSVGAYRAGKKRHLLMDGARIRYSVGSEKIADLDIRDIAVVESRFIETKGANRGPPPEGLSFKGGNGEELLFISGSSDLSYRDLARIARDLKANLPSISSTPG